MTQKDSYRKGIDWADRRVSSSSDDAYEPTYRDGSVRHECWKPDSTPNARKQSEAGRKKSTEKP